MHVEQLKKFAQQSPFRPFTIRLTNGALYVFREPRNFGAPLDLHTIFYFGANDWVLIDPVHVAEVIDRAVGSES